MVRTVKVPPLASSSANARPSSAPRTGRLRPGQAKQQQLGADARPLTDAVLQGLARVGLSADRMPGEDPERHARRIETHLMVLFRETGSDAAFEALYRCTYKPMASWVLHLIGRRPAPAEPLELVQDTYLNVHRYAHTFREGNGNSFRSWARTIAANVLRRARRRAARGVVYMDPAHLPVQESLDPGPCDRLARSEEQAALHGAWILMLAHYHQAWEKLGDRDRFALELVEVEGLKHAEAAVRLGTGRSAIKMIVFRARTRLRGHMRVAMGASAIGTAAASEVGRIKPSAARMPPDRRASA